MEHIVFADTKLCCDIYFQRTPEAARLCLSLDYYLRHSKFLENLKRELNKFADNFSCLNFNWKEPEISASELQYSFRIDGYLALEEPLFIPHKEMSGFEVHFKDYRVADEIWFLIKEAIKTAIFVSNETLISYVETHTIGLLDKGQANFLQSGKEILEIERICHNGLEITEEDVAIGNMFEGSNSLSTFSTNDIETLQEWFEIYANDPAVSDEDKVAVCLGLVSGLPKFQVPDAIISILPGFDELLKEHIMLNLNADELLDDRF